ncbi:MAG: glycosyltransferase, partial [Candidatus Zixiibacteriota bacterium]
MQDLSIKSLSIIIPNYNGAQLLREYFPSVLAAAAKYSGKFEIIIVDDASTDDSRIVITEFTNRHSFIKGIFAKENGGFSKSCNLGMAATQMDICFFLNTDATLKEDCFEHFQEHFENDKVFAVTICGYKMGTSEQIDGIKLGKWRRGKLRATENLLDDDIARLKLSPPFHSLSVQGAYFFADANKLRELNGFDEIYSPFFLEETDLCY